MALPSKIRLEMVTPDRLLLSEEVDAVTIPGSEGYLGVLPGHLPLLTSLGVGILSYRFKGLQYFYAVSDGFAEILPDRVIVMARTVESPEEIDVERARIAKEHAEKRLFTEKVLDVPAVMADLFRATTRLEVARLRNPKPQ